MESERQSCARIRRKLRWTMRSKRRKGGRSGEETRSSRRGRGANHTEVISWSTTTHSSDRGPRRSNSQACNVRNETAGNVVHYCDRIRLEYSHLASSLLLLSVMSFEGLLARELLHLRPILFSDRRLLLTSSWPKSLITLLVLLLEM